MQRRKFTLNEHGIFFFSNVWHLIIVDMFWLLNNFILDLTLTVTNGVLMTNFVKLAGKSYQNLLFRMKNWLKTMENAVAYAVSK